MLSFNSDDGDRGDRGDRGSGGSDGDGATNSNCVCNGVGVNVNVFRKLSRLSMCFLYFVSVG
jgi:hypothetical protein